MRKLGIAVLVLLALVGGCTLLWPERWAVNGPMLHALFGVGGDAPTTGALARFRTPEGLRVSLWAQGLGNLRWLLATPGGDLIATQSHEGRVVRLRRDADGDGHSDGTEVLLTDLNRPHGLARIGEWLYVAENDAIRRIRFDAASGEVSGELKPVLTGLPAGGNHWTRTIAQGPDGWLYLTIGSSCNVCEETDERRAAMLRMHPDGSGVEIYATGLRNSVGFDWRPGTDELYATDNGRDLLGNDFPPCELNRIERGGFYGWPIANGDRVPDPDYGEGQQARIDASIPPAHGFRAHNAPLGIHFVRSPRAPEWLRGAALVALHGSWNRTKKDGYKVVSLHWQPDGSIQERDFLTGFLDGERVLGRPVDVVEGRDGDFFVSDDYAGVVYRIVPVAGAASAAQSLPRSSRDSSSRTSGG